MSESSHFSKCEYRCLQAFSHKSSLSTALWLVFSGPGTICSACAHLPEGWASKSLVTCDNFVLNTSEISFILLILTDTSISVASYLCSCRFIFLI